MRRTGSRSAAKQPEPSPQPALPTKRAKTPVKEPEPESIPSKRVKKQAKEKTKDIPEDDTTKTVGKPVKAKQSAKLVGKEPAKQELKKITMQGSVPVDSHFPKANQSKVVEKDGVVYAVTLNQTNVMANNNKFYIIQILEEAPNSYTMFCRWGRVGVAGQISEMRTNDLSSAIAAYNSKLKDKTKGGYRVVEMNYQNDQQVGQQDDDKKNEENQVQESQLPKEVQDLIRLIFDMKMMNNQMKEIGYDAKKMPLGKLSKSSIQKGYEALNKLMEEVKGQKRAKIFEQYSNDFFSQIPHDFGFINMQNFILNTEKRIKDKLEMLQSLQDIQVYTKILNEGKISSDLNQIDSNYLKLRTEIKPVDKKSQLYAKLIKYVKNTHASTHNNYKLEVEEIYRLDKEQENLRYTKDIPNKQLLWHGSRLTNFVGILSQGLRIAPPEAPVTGYMFGKGVYFADMVSKSANYCCTSRTSNTGLMLLCEVALGNCWQKLAADYYASNLPTGMNSTKGIGRTAPKSGEMIEGAWAPCEDIVPTGANHASLLYNQFIVYDVAQVKSKFLFKMKFNYN